MEFTPAPPNAPSLGWWNKWGVWGTCICGPDWRRQITSLMALRFSGCRQLKLPERRREMYLSSLGFRWKMCYKLQHVAMATKALPSKRGGDCPAQGSPCGLAHAGAPSAVAGWQSQDASPGQAGPYVSDMTGGHWGGMEHSYPDERGSHHPAPGNGCHEEKMGAMLPNLII